jgi:hypothetical protein
MPGRWDGTDPMVPSITMMKALLRNVQKAATSPRRKLQIGSLDNEADQKDD